MYLLFFGRVKVFEYYDNPLNKSGFSPVLDIIMLLTSKYEVPSFFVFEHGYIAYARSECTEKRTFYHPKI